MTGPLGLIGLGLAGQALAARLLAAGYRVVGHDLSDRARQAALALGVELAPDGAAVAAATSCLLLSLPNSDVVKHVLWDQGVAAALRPGSVVLDTTTGRAADARANHERLAAQGVRFVDVTLSGSSEDIAAGKATALIGDAETGADYRCVVECFAGSTHFLGGPGQGCLAKLVVNLVMGLNRAALAEGLALGEKAGLPGEQLLEVLRDSAAYSRVLDMKGERMVRAEYAPASRISQHAKDVDLILELAREVGGWLPLEEVHQRLLQQAVAAGWGDLDNAALIEVLRRFGPRA